MIPRLTGLLKKTHYASLRSIAAQRPEQIKVSVKV